MHPVLKRILVQGALTAGVLALLGVMFVELASLWALAHAGPRTSAALNPPLPPELRYRVPLTLAAGGLLFVAAGELIGHALRRNAPPPAVVTRPAETHPDDVEKLLNDLLAQAEAKMAREQSSPELAAGDRQSEAEKPVPPPV
jgi:hypothetical protein